MHSMAQQTMPMLACSCAWSCVARVRGYCRQRMQWMGGQTEDNRPRSRRYQEGIRKVSGRCNPELPTTRDQHEQVNMPGSSRGWFHAVQVHTPANAEGCGGYMGMGVGAGSRFLLSLCLPSRCLPIPLSVSPRDSLGRCRRVQRPVGGQECRRQWSRSNS